MRMGRGLTALAMAAALLVGGSRASAQDIDTFDAQNFKPALTPYGYVTIEGAKRLGFLTPHAAIHFSWAHNPLKLSESRPVIGERDVIRDLSMLDFIVALGLLEFGNGGLDIAVDLPLAVDVNGIEIADVNPDGRLKGVPEMAFGDLRTTAKLTLMDREDDPIGIALVAEFQWPIDRENRDAYVTDEEFQMRPMLVIDKKVSLLRIAAMVGYEYIHGGDIETLDVTIDDRLHIGLALGIEPFDPDAVPLAIVVEALHWTRWEQPWNHEEESPVEINAAVKYYGTLFAQLGAGAGLNEGVGAPDARIFAALGFTF